MPRCASLSELAAKLGIDGNCLVNEVGRFNRFARTGLDDDFHRGENQWKLAAAKAARGSNASLGTIEEPPFYGVELHPTGAASVGLRVNGSGQVIISGAIPFPGSTLPAMSRPPRSTGSAIRPACRSPRR